MANDAVVDKGRRRFLTATTAVVGGAGVVAAVIPFIKSWEPSAAAKSAGAPVEADISKIEPGQKVTFAWRGLPVFVVNRTKPQLDSLAAVDSLLKDPKSENTDQQPDYAKNEYRSIKPEVWVGVGICSHLGCSPSDKFQPGAQPSLPDDWQGGFLCPCHGSTFDVAGRVFKNKPAPDNLEVPPHMYLSDNRLLIGEDKNSKA